MGILMETTEATLDTASYRSGRREPQYFGAMGSPGEYYTDTLHTISIKTRETEFGKIVEPIPITLKAYKPFQVHHLPLNGMPLGGYGLPPQPTISSYMPVPHVPEYGNPSTSQIISPVKEVKASKSELIKAPKKKWIKEYLEEEPVSSAPASPVSLRVVTGLAVTARGSGAVRPTSPVPVLAPAPAPPPVTPPVPPAALTPAPLAESAPAATAAPAPAPAPAPLLDFAQEHSRPRTTSNGPTQIPSPPSVGSSSGSSGSAPRAGTREVHNKLEKNRRAHLKECFEMLKRQLPATPDDKKCSNLSILGSAIRYIQVLRRKERECEHEMERLAREKIAAQQRLAALKREVTVRAAARPRTIDPISDDKIREEQVNGQVLGISIASSPPRARDSPPHTLNLSTKLRTLPIQITPTTSQQVVRSSYGARHNTLTLTTLAPVNGTSHQNGHSLENGVTNALSTLVHPAQLHLPISQVVGRGGGAAGGGALVVGGASLQLVSTSAGLRVLHAPHTHTNGISTGDNHRIPKSENGMIPPTPVSTDGNSVVVSGLTPIVVSQPGTHLLQTHTLTHKMVETQMVKGSVTPLTVSAQYLTATTIVKPVVVVSAHEHSPPA